MARHAVKKLFQEFQVAHDVRFLGFALADLEEANQVQRDQTNQCDYNNEHHEHTHPQYPK